MQDPGGALRAVRTSGREIDDGKPDNQSMEKTGRFLGRRGSAKALEEACHARDDAVREFAKQFAQLRLFIASLRGP